MSEKFTVEIISPNKSILQTEASEVLIPSFEGEMGIMKDHIPLITFLRPGSIKIMSDPVKEFFVEEGTVEFTDIDSANTSNLANLIFLTDGVERVFLATEFISVTKNNDTHWEILKPLILTAIMDHYASGKEVIKKNQNETSKSIIEDTEVVKQIKELIEQRVRPAVAMDGGDISFCSFEDGVVTLQMKGACAGCPSSTATLKMGIENMLRHYIPEVVEVKAAEL